MRTRRRAVAVVGVMVVMIVTVTLSMGAPAMAGGGCHALMGGESVTQGTGATVELKGACMTPTVLRVEPGTDVTFVNRDEMVHNVYGAGVAVEDFGLAQSATVRYGDPGVYPYACLIHVGMVGAIVVGDGIGGKGITASDVQPVTATQPIAAETPVAAAPADEPTSSSDSTALIVLATVALTALVVAGSYAFGRRSAGVSE